MNDERTEYIALLYQQYLRRLMGEEQPVSLNYLSERGIVVGRGVAFVNGTPYNRENLGLALENLRKGRNAFATEEAYQKQVKLFTKAIEMMDEEMTN